MGTSFLKSTVFREKSQFAGDLLGNWRKFFVEINGKSPKNPQEKSKQIPKKPQANLTSNTLPSLQKNF
jgi:hypothetical protein